MLGARALFLSPLAVLVLAGCGDQEAEEVEAGPAVDTPAPPSPEAIVESREVGRALAGWLRGFRPPATEDDPLISVTAALTEMPGGWEVFYRFSRARDPDAPRPGPDPEGIPRDLLESLLLIKFEGRGSEPAAVEVQAFRVEGQTWRMFVPALREKFAEEGWTLRDLHRPGPGAPSDDREPAPEPDPGE